MGLAEIQGPAWHRCFWVLAVQPQWTSAALNAHRVNAFQAYAWIPSVFAFCGWGGGERGDESKVARAPSKQQAGAMGSQGPPHDACSLPLGT